MICIFFDQERKFTVHNALLVNTLNVHFPALVKVSCIPACSVSSHFCPDLSGEASLQIILAPISDLHIQSAERRGPAGRHAAGRSTVSLSCCSPLSIIELIRCRQRRCDGPFDHSAPDPVITLPKIEQWAPLIVTAGNLNCAAALRLLL